MKLEGREGEQDGKPQAARCFEEANLTHLNNPTSAEMADPKGWSLFL